MAIETYKLASGAVRYRATTYTENPTWIRENLLDFLSACEKETNIRAPPSSDSSPSLASEPEN